jgi:dihydroorotate dehydrogenase
MYYIAAPFGNYIRTEKAKSVIGTFTLSPRPGLVKQIIKTLRYKKGAWYNAIGLRNPGIDAGLKYYYRSEKDVISVASIEPGDWKRLNRVLPESADIEVNISCPNVEHYKNYVGGVDSFLNGKRKVIVKLSPTTSDPMIEHLMHCGFTSFHCCNTLPTENGAMSGRGLREYTSTMINTVHFMNPNAEIIAGGGIETLEDVHYYSRFGATSFSIGSICFHPLKLRKLLNSIIIIPPLNVSEDD